MNHNILNKIFDKIELPKEAYKAIIERGTNYLNFHRYVDSSYFYKIDDALAYIKYHHMHHLLEVKKQELSVIHRDTFSHISTIKRVDKMEEYYLLIGLPTFENLTDEQKESKIFDIILREKLQNGYVMTNKDFGYQIVTKSIKSGF